MCNINMWVVQTKPYREFTFGVAGPAFIIEQVVGGYEKYLKILSLF